MAYELIITDDTGKDKTLVENYYLDLAYGQKDNNFEVRFKFPRLKGGELIYIDGTEYGGIVDTLKGDTSLEDGIYTGRTWQGILASRVFLDDKIKETAGELVQRCISANKLHAIFTYKKTPEANIALDLAFKTDEDRNKETDKKDRPDNWYQALVTALKSKNLRLAMKRELGTTLIWVEHIQTITNELNSDIASFTASRTLHITNHLIAYGELKERKAKADDEPKKLTLHVYANEKGEVSQTQTFTGAKEIQAYKKFSGFTLEDGQSATTELKKQLLEKATKELKEMQKFGKADTHILGVGAWYVGDRLEAENYNVGFKVEAEITRKIVRVEHGILTVDYELGGDTSKAEAIKIFDDIRPKRLYNSRPTGNYIQGDMWVQTTTGELLICVADKQGKFSEDDWQKATRYTDDTLAKQAQAKAAQAAQTAASVVQTIDDVRLQVETAQNVVTELTGTLEQHSQAIKQTETKAAKAATTAAERAATEAVKSASEAIKQDTVKSVELSVNQTLNKTKEAIDKQVKTVSDTAAKAVSATNELKTLIRSDASGVIVGKLNSKGALKDVTVTRQTPDMFEIAHVGTNGEFERLAGFSSDRIVFKSQSGEASFTFQELNEALAMGKVYTKQLDFGAGATAHLIRRGSLVFMTFNKAWWTLDGGVNRKVFSLPKGFRPQSNYRTQIPTQQGVLQLNAYPSGDVYLHNPTGSRKNPYIDSNHIWLTSEYNVKDV